jgi:hypothetical protein
VTSGVVNPVAAHSGDAGRSSRGRLLVFLVRLLGGGFWAGENAMAAGGGAEVKEGLFLDPGDSCRCVGGVNVEHAQRSEHERR